MANYRAPDREQSLADAVTTYLAFKQREHDQKLLSISQLDHIRRHLGVLKKRFPAVRAAHPSADFQTIYAKAKAEAPELFISAPATSGTR